MTARFRLPAGRSYNVRASELARDSQHTEVVCNILLLDNTVQSFNINVSITTNSSIFMFVYSMFVIHCNVVLAI